MAQVSRLSTNTPKGVNTIKGDYYLDHKNYTIALNNYTKSLNRNPKDIHAILGMAEAYHKLGKDDLAGNWYSKAFSINPEIQEEYILKYISILNKSEKYDELRHWIMIYNDRVRKKYLSNGTHDRYKDSTLLLLHDLQTINSPKSDLSPLLYNDKLIFSSNRAVSGDGNYNLYTSGLNPNGRYEESTPFHEIINSGANEGPMAIAQKSGKLFFTRTSQSKSDNKPLMEMFYCDLPADRSDQVKINKLTFKKFNYDIGHPAVNSEGTLLFFTANNPKHARGFELYRSEYIDKKWSDPKALGAHINTHGDEMYPTLYNDSILYFASNGHGGLGGFDIYKVNLLAKHLRIEHLNSPINSPSDDFGLIINSNGHEGYFTSNRPGGSGGDDLYRFYVLPVKTKVVENMPKPEELSIYTSKGDEIKLSGNNNENLVFEFIPGRRYSLLMDYDNYKTGTSKTNSGKTDLPKRNTYAFHIQKSDGVVYEDKKRSTRVQDVHINPGDLVTFQLIPNMSLDYEADDSRIRFNKAEAAIHSNDTIVFSYVAEGDSKIPDAADASPIADLNAANKNDLSRDDKVEADTVSSTPILAKNTQPDNKTHDTNAGKVVETIQPDKLKDKSEANLVSTSVTSDVIASQNKEPIEQSQAVSNEKNIDVNTANGNALEAVQQNKKELNDPIAADSLTSTERIVAKENIPSTVLEKNSLNTVKQADDTSMKKGDPFSDPVNKNNAVAKNKQAGDSSHIISRDAIALQNKETTEQSQSVSKDKNVDLNAASENALEAAQQNTLSPANEHPARDAGESNDFRYRVQIAASRSELRDTQLKKIYSGSKEIRSFNEEGYYKYYIEETPSYPDAKRVLKESNVDNAFIAAYKGSIKWKLSEAIAFQKKEFMQQPQPDSEDKNVDPVTVNGQAMETANKLTDTPNATTLEADATKTNASRKDSDNPVTENSLIGSDKTAGQKENISDNKLEKNPVITTQQADNSITTGYQPADSLNKNNDVAEKDRVMHPSQSLTGENNDFQYRVQIAASKSLLSDAQLKKIYSDTRKIRFFKEDGYYKYYIQETPNYYIAKQSLKESNIDNAFISAYKGETKWHLQDAVALQYKVPPRSELAKTDSVVKIVTVNFELDKFVLSPTEKLHLREYVIDQLKANNSYHAVVNGYTDIRGSEEYNFGLSQERAFFVEQLIISEGINSERVTTQYFGESQLLKYCPENKNCDESVHKANRRAEILLLMSKK